MTLGEATRQYQDALERYRCVLGSPDFEEYEHAKDTLDLARLNMETVWERDVENKSRGWNIGLL